MPAWGRDLEIRLDLYSASRRGPTPAELFVLVRRKRATGSGSLWQVGQCVFSIQLPPFVDNEVRVLLHPAID